MLLFCIVLQLINFFFFKQKTAYEMRISDWSSDVCSSDLTPKLRTQAATLQALLQGASAGARAGQDREGALRQALDAAGLEGRYQLQVVDSNGWRLTFKTGRASGRERGW